MTESVEETAKMECCISLQRSLAAAAADKQALTVPFLVAAVAGQLQLSPHSSLQLEKNRNF